MSGQVTGKLVLAGARRAGEQDVHLPRVVGGAGVQVPVEGAEVAQQLVQVAHHVEPLECARPLDGCTPPACRVRCPSTILLAVSKNAARSSLPTASFALVTARAMAPTPMSYSPTRCTGSHRERRGVAFCPG